MLFRKGLVRVRKEYNLNPKNLFLYSGIASILGILLTLLCDIFLPFVLWGQSVRGLILIPTSAAFFVLGYGFSLFLHYSKVAADPTWVPFRLRYSPTWRRRIALIVGAMMFVGIYANGFRIGYTAIAAVFVAMVIGLFAFIRTTKDEANREELNIPDSRDTKYEDNLRKLEKQREEKRKKKEAARKEVKPNRLNGMKQNNKAKKE